MLASSHTFIIVSTKLSLFVVLSYPLSSTVAPRLYYVCPKYKYKSADLGTEFVCCVWCVLESVMLKIVSSRHSYVWQKIGVLEELKLWCDVPQRLIELFLNYDNDQNGLPNGVR